jgi:hypothetical protein
LISDESARPLIPARTSRSVECARRRRRAARCRSESAAISPAARRAVDGGVGSGRGRRRGCSGRRSDRVGLESQRGADAGEGVLRAHLCRRREVMIMSTGSMVRVQSQGA